MNLTTATPAEIDTVIAEIHERAYAPFSRLQNALNLIQRIEDSLAYDKRTYYKQSNLDSAKVTAQKCQAEFDAIIAEAKPLEAEYARRPWTRAFLVLNTGGHIHRDRNCSTCRWNTRYGWLPQESGKAEAEIVDGAGADACTVCYPTAPVVSLNRPRRTLHASEVEAAKAREIREQAKADRLAKKIAKSLTADGSEFRVEYKTGGWVRNGNEQTWVEGASAHSERFATEQAATSWMVQQIVWNDGSGKAEAFTAIKDAIAAKHGKSSAEVDVLIEKKVADKRKRDAR